LLYTISVGLLFPVHLLAQISTGSTFWEENKWATVVTLVLLSLQGLFIGILLVERRKRKRAGEALRAAAAVHEGTGDRFFRSLAEHLSNVLRVDHVSIGELSHCGKRIKTVAVSEGGENADNLEYELEHTPCQKVLELDRFFDRSGIQAHFPLDVFLSEKGFQSYLGVALVDSVGHRLGVMSVLSRHPLKNAGIAEVTLDLFAARASAEMERRRSERALHASEARNRAILNAMPDLMFVLDRAGKLLDYSACNLNQLYAPPEQFLGKNVRDVLPADAAETITRTVEQTITSAEPSTLEFSLPMPDGPSFFEARMVLLDDAKVLAIVRDVTSRKKTENELDKSRHFTDRIAQTIPNVLFVYDLVDKRNVYVNQRSWEVLGYTAREVLDMGDRFLASTLHPEDLARLPQLAEAYSGSAEGAVLEHQFRMKHKNGEWRWIQRRAAVFARMEDGRPRQVLGTATDVTDFKKAEEELRELSARLLTTQDVERRRIARELHDGTAQNLFALRLNLGLLQERLRASPAGSILADSILKECQTLCDLSLDEIRTLSYLLHPPILDEGGLIAALSWFAEGIAKRSGLVVKVKIPSDMERLPVALERDLFRIAQEALSNILRHSGSKNAEVHLERNAREVILLLRDFGHGMPAKASQEPDAKTSRGVGITSMRERLRQIGGRLEIQSNNEGTTIIAIVPLQTDSTDPPPRGRTAYG